MNNYGDQYRQLINELGDKVSRKHGWKRHVAAQIGISAEYLSRIINHEKTVSWELVERACQRLGLDASYFGVCETTASKTTVHQDPLVNALDAFMRLTPEQRVVFRKMIEVIVNQEPQDLKASSCPSSTTSKPDK